MKKVMKHYISKKKIEEVAEEFMDTIQEAETYFRGLSDKMGEIRSKYEIEYIADDLIKLSTQGKVKQISTSWLQRKYKIGYARSARLIDSLSERKIIIPSKNPKDSQPTAWIIK